MTDHAAIGDGSRAFFFDLAAVPASTVADRRGAVADGLVEGYDAAFGSAEIDVKRIVMSERLTVNWAYVHPNGSVARHSHGTNQLTFVLDGELYYGNRCISQRMGRFGPDAPYAWTAGPAGATVLEIHDGVPRHVFR